MDPALSSNQVPVATIDIAGRLGLHIATVTGRADKWVFVGGPSEPALRAESCLLEPDTGDLVLVCPALPAMPPTEGVAASVSVPYVLAVLSRAPSSSATLTLPGGARIDTTGGEMKLSATHIALDGRERVSTATQELALESVTATLSTCHANTRIGTLDAGIDRLTLVARSFVSTIGRLIVRAKDSTRWIDGTDELRASHARWRVSEDAHLNTRNTTLVSEAITRIDGSKIELG